MASDMGLMVVCETACPLCDQLEAEVYRLGSIHDESWATLRRNLTVHYDEYQQLRRKESDALLTLDITRHELHCHQRSHRDGTEIRAIQTPETDSVVC
jgi:hypothetical protein